MFRLVRFLNVIFYFILFWLGVRLESLQSIHKRFMKYFSCLLMMPTVRRLPWTPFWNKPIKHTSVCDPTTYYALFFIFLWESGSIKPLFNSTFYLKESNNWNIRLFLLFVRLSFNSHGHGHVGPNTYVRLLIYSV